MAREYRFDFKGLDVYQGALEHFGWCIEVSKRIPWQQKAVTGQLLRAGLSAPLNIAEAGGRRTPGEAAQHLRYAQGSVYESAAMLDALARMGVVDDEAYNRQEQLLARVASMLTAMQRKKAREVSEGRPGSRSRSRE